MASEPMTPREHLDAVCDRVGAADAVVHAALAAWEADRERADKAEATLHALVAELVGLFGWSDTSAVHALMHVSNAVKNERADFHVERDALLQRVASLLPLARETVNRDIQMGVCVADADRA